MSETQASKPTQNQQNDNLILGVGFACLNAFMLAATTLFAKILGQYFGPIEVTFIRNFLAMLILLAWLIYAGRLALLKTERPWAHLFRSAVGTVGIALGMWAVTVMTLAQTNVLLFTSPLFTLILSMLFLKECVGPYRISAIILGFLGVVIFANPFGGEFSISTLGLILGLAWGFGSGCVDTILRWMGKTENATATTFYFVTFGSIATGLYLPFATIDEAAFSLPSLWAMLGLGIVGVTALLAKTQSFRLGEASVIAPVMYTMIIWSLAFDYIVWGTIPTWNVLAGAAMIIGANLIILFREHQQGRLRRPSMIEE